VSNPTYTPTNGQAQDLFVHNVVYSDLTAGGLIVSGALKGTDFGPGGTVGAFQYGQDAGATFMVGGDPTAFRATDTEALASPLRRENFYSRATYDLDGNTVLFSDLLLGHSQITNLTTPYTALGNLSIAQTNAYLPTSIKNLMIADKLKTISVGRLFTEFGDLEDQQQAYTEQLKVGAKGTLGGVWSWDAFASYGATERSIHYGNDPILANLTNSVNAVVSPTTGQPVCAIALTTPSTTCVPADIFGPGSVSSAAANYILGTSIMNMDFYQTEVAANVRGDPFSLWAGPVSIALGLEFRREAVTASTDPLTAAGAFYVNDGVLTDGSYYVGEGYFESVVPLARNLPLLKSLDFDGGVRVSDYSTSGVVPSYKFGLTDQVSEDLRLRAEFSRDIRAPNLTELFLKRSTTISNVTDPTNNSTVTVTAYGGGNTSLMPETANTYTLGFIYDPHFIPGLGISVDYYNIDLVNAIGTLSAQLIVNECYQGVSSVCNQITRVNGVISTVSATEINIASYKATGFDFEVDYRLEPTLLKIPGTFDFRFLATYIDTLKENTGSSIVDLAGDITNGSPRVKATGTANYLIGPLKFTARARFVEGGSYSKQITVDATVPSVTYVDLGVEYDVPNHDNYTIYANVNNLANAVNPLDFNPIYYDIIGRTFNVGLRVRY
jgi:outer membrane receptor protein involved in Fe transport